MEKRSKLIIKREAMKSVPRRDGSGKGIRANRGRGGCKVTRRVGKR